MRITAMVEAQRLGGRWNADCEAITTLCALVTGDGVTRADRLAAVEQLESITAELRASLPRLRSAMARMRQGAPDVFESFAALVTKQHRATVDDCNTALVTFLDGLDAMIANARPFLAEELGVTYARPMLQPCAPS